MTELLVPPHYPADQLDPSPNVAPGARRGTGYITLGLDLTGLGVSTSPWTPAADEHRAEIDQKRVAALVRAAESVAFAFVGFDEEFALAPALQRTAASRLDAARVACRLASVTAGIGLMATLDTSYLDPVHVATALATLHAKSGGRAAWQVGASQARLLGSTEEVWDRLGREIRTVVPGLAASAPPAERPSIVVRAESAPSIAVAGALADVVRIESLDAQRARALREQVRAAAAAAGRDPDSVRVLADAVVLVSADAASARARRDILGDLATGEPQWRRTLSHLGNGAQLADLLDAWFSDGVVDGFTLVPGSLPHDVRALVADVVPVLQERGLARPFYGRRDGSDDPDETGQTTP